MACTRRIGQHIITLLLGFGLLGGVQALPDDDRLLPQRYQFQEALQALEAGNRARFRNLADKLRDYPLYPYLEYADLRHRLARAKPEEIRDFVHNYGDSPIAGLLHQRWLYRLASHGRWQQLVNNYQITNDKTLRCHYTRALYEVDQAQQAHAAMENLWLTGHSLPAACDPAIASWHRAGRLSNDLVWQRIQLAIGAGEIRLALFLADYLPESQRFWVNIWSKIRRNPEYLREVTNHFNDVEQPVLRWITVYGLRRLADRDPIRAARYWQELKPDYQFSDQEQERIERRLSLELVRSEDPQAPQWLERLKLGNERTEVKTVHILSALQDRDWSATGAPVPWGSWDVPRRPAPCISSVPGIAVITAFWPPTGAVFPIISTIGRCCSARTICVPCTLSRPCNGPPNSTPLAGWPMPVASGTTCCPG